MSSTPNEKQAWGRVEAALQGAKAASFDGCHKIYVLLDDEQVEFEKTLNRAAMITVDGTRKNRLEALSAIKGWFESSCGLRFVQSVRTVEGDSNKGFEDLIPQM